MQGGGSRAPPERECTVLVAGPDAKGLKASYAAFNVQNRDGRTTLSCSGLLLPPSSYDGAPAEERLPTTTAWHVLAPVSCLFPFLQASQRRQLADVTADSLLPGVEVAVLLRPQDASGSTSSSALVRVRLRLAAVLPLPGVQAAAEQLLTATNAGSGGAWRLGWALADRQPLAAGTAAVLGHLMLLELQSAAVGSVSALQPQLSSSAPASSSNGSRGSAACGCSPGSSSQSLLGRVGSATPGQGVAVTGSPFACLAAQQFHGAVVTGCVSLVLPPPRPGATAAAAGASSGQPPLFVVDGRCLPGMEGGPVRCRCCGALLGVLGLPLTNSTSQVELLLAVNAYHLAAVLQEALPRLQQPGRQQLAAASASAAGASGSLHRQQAAGTVRAGQHQQRQLAAAGPLRRLQVHMQQLTAVLPDPEQPQQQQQLTAAPTAAVLMDSPQQASHGLSNSTDGAAALQAAATGVVMVRAGRSWGSGVLITHSGLVLTVAHLFRTSGAGTPAQQQQQQQVLDVSVLLSVPHSSTGTSRRKLWLPARVLHCFTGHLDLAVLQVDHAHIASLEPGLLRPLQLAGRADTVSPGDAAFVIGHGLFGPRLACPPAITGGCVARVLSIPNPAQQQQQLGHPAGQGALKPSMVISTAAVHAGASGGALVDASGRLQGLVTSNARHARGATLPHLNFCISAAELAPVWAWAQQQWQQPDDGSGLAALDVRAQGDGAGARLWALQPFA